jgi:hypothetical protein
MKRNKINKYPIKALHYNIKMDYSISNSTLIRDFTPVDYSRHNVPFFLSTSPLAGCSNISFDNTKDSNLQRAMYSGMAILSIVSTIIVATMIFYNAKLRIHPSKLIGYMCICEAASCFSALIWVIDPRAYICYFGIHYLWTYTTG